MPYTITLKKKNIKIYFIFFIVSFFIALILSSTSNQISQRDKYCNDKLLVNFDKNFIDKDSVLKKHFKLNLLDKLSNGEYVTENSSVSFLQTNSKNLEIFFENDANCKILKNINREFNKIEQDVVNEIYNYIEENINEVDKYLTYQDLVIFNNKRIFLKSVKNKILYINLNNNEKIFTLFVIYMTLCFLIFIFLFFIFQKINIKTK